MKEDFILIWKVKKVKTHIALDVETRKKFKIAAAKINATKNAASSCRLDGPERQEQEVLRSILQQAKSEGE